MACFWPMAALSSLARSKLDREITLCVDSVDTNLCWSFVPIKRSESASPPNCQKTLQACGPATSQLLRGTPDPLPRPQACLPTLSNSLGADKLFKEILALRIHLLAHLPEMIGMRTGCLQIGRVGRSEIARTMCSRKPNVCFEAIQGFGDYVRITVLFSSSRL